MSIEKLSGGTDRLTITVEGGGTTTVEVAPIIGGASGGAAYDDTPIKARVSAVEAAVAAIPAPVASLPWTAITGKPSAFAPAAHSHAWADITDRPPIPTPYDDAALQGRVQALEKRAFAAVATSGAYADLLGIPATFAPSAHTHAWSQVTGKPSTFAPAAHSHAISDVTGLQSALDGKQPATSFKTVNGTAITGAGDIAIPSGDKGDKGEAGKGWTGGSYDNQTGKVTFASGDGLGFATEDLRGPAGTKGDKGDKGAPGTNVTIRTATSATAATLSAQYPNDLIVVTA